ncbi:MAG TPA: ATP-binding protein [Candidatus Sulfotelmatobacter sp.]
MAATTPFPRPFSGTGSELRLLFENAPLGVAQCDRQGNVLAMNAALSTLLGESCSSFPFSRFQDLIPEPDRQLGEGILRQLMNGERASFQTEARFRRAEQVRWLRWTAWGVCGGTHNPDCVLLLAQDITKERERELNPKENREAGHPAKQGQRVVEPAERLQSLGRMAGGIAHDFNNLLTGILLYCDLMLDCLAAESQLAAGRQRENDRLRKYAEEIRCAGLQATGVVRQLLNMTGPRNPGAVPLSLNATADGMRNLLLRLMSEKIELSFHLEPALGLVSMDSAQAQQVLLNLVLNARDAMPTGGRIRVETSNCVVQFFPQGNPEDAGGRPPSIPCVLFVVSDSGSGMDEETRQRVFEPYFTTKEEGKGSGLGLATVHSIVSGQGGLVHIDSALGRGTRVTVLLPSMPASAALPSSRQSLPRAS